MQNLLSEIGNWIWVVGASAGFVASIVWLIRNNLSHISKTFIYAFIIINVAIILRTCYWAIAIEYALPGDLHAAWAYDYKHIQGMISAGIYLFGVIAFLGGIEEYSTKRKIFCYFSLIALSGLVAVLI